MRRSIIACSAAAVLLALAPSAAQSQGYYAGVSGGTATYFDQNNLEYDYFGFVIAGQAGMRLSPELRVEGEIAYESTTAEVDGTSIDVDVTAIRPSISAYYDFTTATLGGLTPYAGGGLGISFLDFDFDTIFGDVEDEELSAHFEGGGSMSLGGGLEIVPAARWELTDDASNVQLRVGVRFGL